MPNKRVGQASKPTFSREYKVDKYKLQNENIQLQRMTKLPIYKWMHLNPENITIEAHKHAITLVPVIQVYLFNTI
jgi:hypothetical protein